MQIVILDSESTTGDDLDWSGLFDLGEVVAYPYTAPREVVARAREAEAILTNKVPLSAAVLAQLPKLRYIGVVATGYDRIDVQAARARGIPVCHAAGYGTEAVAQHVFALLLALTNQVARHSADVHAGGWTAQGSWTYRLTPLVELPGMTLGLVGMGRIGSAVAALGQAFGMRILAYSRSRRDLPGVAWADDLPTLFAQGDVLSLHCPLTPETEGLVDAALLGHMKPSAYLINTARGGLVQAAALAEALHAGQIAGAGLDVLSPEPPPADHPLLGAPRCLLTPHNAWGARAARQRLIDQTVDNLRAFLAGRPQQVVNGGGSK